MATKSDTKKQLEELLGEKLDDDAVQLIQLVQRVALSTVTSGETTQRHIFGDFPNTCSSNNVLDVSGYASTGSNGQRLFRLSDFLCVSDRVFHYPINFIATPFSSQPRFLTATYSIVNNGADIEIKVFAWDANGVAAQNVYFNWRCRAEIERIVE
jgi:hypothetical protein